jgi:Helix-turn-helix.
MTTLDTLFTGSTDQPTRLVRERKAALALAGLTGADIARQIGVTKAAVSAVILGHTRNPRIRVAIAHACGQPVEVLFPQTADAERMDRARSAVKVA